MIFDFLEILQTYMEDIRRKYNPIRDIFLCNWHILWQNAFYLYLGKSKQVQDDHYKWLHWRHEDYLKIAQEKCNLQVSIPPRQKLNLSRFIKAQQMSQLIELTGFQIIASNVFILKCYLFMGLYNPYWTRKTQGLCKPIWNRRAH